MIQLGELQTLTVARKTDNGVYLTAENSIKKEASIATAALKEESILLPKNQVPEGTTIGSSIRVFVYKDSEDRPIATTTIPPITLGEVAVLTVKEVGKIGAFLDWGLAKDLLLPFREQTTRVKEGDSVIVALYIDKSNRLCATMHVYEYLSTDSPYKKDDRVTGTVYDTIEEFGMYIAVDNCYSAMVPRKELIQPLRPGTVVSARVTAVHEDGKLELSLREKSYMQMTPDSESILKLLQEAGGFLPYHDKSNPEAIKAKFGLSKNAFKRAIGHLFKEGTIVIEETGIRFVEK